MPLQCTTTPSMTSPRCGFSGSRPSSASKSSIVSSAEDVVAGAGSVATGAEGGGAAASTVVESVISVVKLAVGRSRSSALPLSRMGSSISQDRGRSAAERWSGGGRPGGQRKTARRLTGGSQWAGDGLFSAEGCPPSIVGAAAFHCRVRDGNGWCRRALITSTAPSISRAREDPTIERGARSGGGRHAAVRAAGGGSASRGGGGGVVQSWQSRWSRGGSAP